ncbi:MAG: hypothetical protein IJJ72_04580 [Bacteroidales bacterium]|nr:hypothetical protein [Bacteroidales bacterium]
MKDSLRADDIVAFLLNAYFRNVDDPLIAAANLAYLDLNRTIEFKTVKSFSEKRRDALRTKSVRLIKTQVLELMKKSDMTQGIFDIWHIELCRAIVKNYTEDGVPFHYGQAQKWVNMSFKYLSVIDCEETAGIQEFLHIPIDSIIIEMALEDFQLERPLTRWSRMEEEDYLHYQEQLSKIVRERNGIPPFLWEFRRWNKKVHYD